MRRFLANSAVLFLGVTVALALGETVARIFRPLSTVEYSMLSEVGPVLTPLQQTRWVNEDYDVKIFTNSAGFHDVEHPTEKPAGVYRILVLGDSYVEALQVPIEEGFTQRLQHELGTRVTGRRIEVINLGVSGSGPSQYYRILEQKGLAYAPDLVIMAMLPGNDFRDSLPVLSGVVFKPYYSIRSDGTLEYIPPDLSGLGTQYRSFLRRSAFLHLIRKVVVSGTIEGWLAQIGLLAPAGAVNQGSAKALIPLDWYVYVKDPPDPWPEAYRITLRMIRESRELAARHGAEFLVMIVASTVEVEVRWEEALRGYGRAGEFQWDFQRPSREIFRVGKELGFESIDLREPFQADFLATGQSGSWPHDGHWNERGHQLAAEVVADHLVRRREQYHLN